MHLHLAPDDSPDTTTPFEVVGISGINHLHDIIRGRAHAVNVTNAMCMVGVLEGQPQI